MWTLEERSKYKIKIGMLWVLKIHFEIYNNFEDREGS